MQAIPDDTDASHRILIVDDEECIAEPFEAALQEEGREVRSTTCGKEAIRLISLFEPDLLVTDIIVPEIDVLELIAELRRARPQLKILAMSGNKYLLRLAVQYGADHVMPKPFPVSELKTLVRKLLKM